MCQNDENQHEERLNKYNCDYSESWHKYIVEHTISALVLLKIAKKEKTATQIAKTETLIYL